MKRDHLAKIIFSVLAVGILFLLVSYISARIELAEILQNSPINVLIYLLILISECIFAPISATPLIPAAIEIFGFWPSVIYTTLGWTAGSYGAFWIARDYGKRIAGKVVSLRRIEELQEYIPEKEMFVRVLLLKIFFPLDVLNYAIGILTEMKKIDFLLISLISSLFFALVFAFLGTVQEMYQAAAFIIGGAIFIILSHFYLRIRMKEKCLNIPRSSN